MYGALFGDFVGSKYALNNIKSKNFQLLSDESRFTDVSIMTIAIAESIMNYFEYDSGTKDFSGKNDEDNLAYRYQVGMRKWAFRYPNAGYDDRFLAWKKTGSATDNSDNGSAAMRVSPVAWLFDDVESVRKAAKISAAVTHNHPVEIMGAEAIASAVFLARTGAYKPEIKKYIEEEFGYDLDRNVSCRGSVPEAVSAFLEGRDLVDVVRNAVSLGGDSDTIAAMAGSVAEGYYGAYPDVVCEVKRNLDEEQNAVLQRFEEMAAKRINLDENEHVNLSRWRVFILPDDEMEIAKNYVDHNNIKKTAEAFDITELEVIDILHKAERYTDRLYRENISVDKYINELSPLEFVRGEGKKLRIWSRNWITDDDQLIIDMLCYSIKELSAEEISIMTGIPERRVKRTLRNLNQQKHWFDFHTRDRSFDDENDGEK